MPAPVVAAGIGAAGGLGSALLSRGKKTKYTQGLSPQAQGISNQVARYISQGMQRPHAYAQVNPMATNAMDVFSRAFYGKPYAQPQYGMSAPGGGPMGMPGMPQGGGQAGITPYGMPRQMGPQYPQMPMNQQGMGFYRPPMMQRGNYGGRMG